MLIVRVPYEIHRLANLISMSNKANVLPGLNLEDSALSIEKCD